MSRRYTLSKPRVRSFDWRPEEDAILREFSGRGCGWVAAYRLPNRSVHAINARRRLLDAKEGQRLPRLYREVRP